MPRPQNSTGPSPCQEWLDLPEEGTPRSSSLSLFAWTQLPCASTWPLPAAPHPSPAVEGVASSQCPREGSRRGRRSYVCVTVVKTLRYLAIRGCFRWVSGRGDKERKSRVSSSSGSSSRGGGSRAGPHLLAGCRGNGRHGGPSSPSSPRQSKQDRWAWAWRD